MQKDLIVSSKKTFVSFPVAEANTVCVRFSEVLAFYPSNQTEDDGTSQFYITLIFSTGSRLDVSYGADVSLRDYHLESLHELIRRM